MGKADQLLAPVAHAQHGPFTHAQALAAGFSRSAFGRRVEGGKWLALHRAVFCDSAVPRSLRRDIAAAVLACGDGSAASYRSAARLWEIETPIVDDPDITVLAPARPRLPGIRIHRTTRLTSAEAARMDGIRVTSPIRTLLELSLDRMWQRGLVDPRRFVSYLADPWCVNRRGSSALRRLTTERCGDRASGSDLETLLLQLIREANLPLPARQHAVTTPFGVRYLDLAYPLPKIAIEVDGMDSRLNPDVFLDDRLRQNLIEAQGWTFRRFGYQHITRSAFWTTITLRSAATSTDAVDEGSGLRVSIRPPNSRGADTHMTVRPATRDCQDSRRRHRVFRHREWSVVLAIFLTVAPAAPAPGSQIPNLRPGAQFSVPLYGTLVKTYDAPLDNPYAPGHRADNIAAAIGTPVRASADGVVSFAGNVAGNLSVTVDHPGSIKTTYSYLGTIVAKKNQRVLRGDVIGTVGAGHDASLPPNVQLSARRNNVYFDPLELYVGSSYADLVQLVG